jgi:hypothetical protein
VTRRDRPVDVHVSDHGSVIGFAFVSDPAKAWAEEHVHAEPWQRIGSYIWVDRRLAEPLCVGLQEADFIVRA